MSGKMTENDNPYTCTDYRAEMILLGLNLRLTREDLPENEKEKIRNDIRKLEAAMGMG